MEKERKKIFNKEKKIQALYEKPVLRSINKCLSRKKSQILYKK